jgi:hypothetical protein|tara:strand:+ start:511 stop:987 length:477 start_codon:yes stop_codon:yes gene_type:complete
MPEFNVRETFEVIGKAKTREEKRDLLKQRENFATKAILQLNFHPAVKWLLPAGSPPYTPSTEGDMTSNSLHFEVKKLDYYTDPSPHSLDELPMLRRESMFVSLLERLDPEDAKLMISVKDGKLSYKGLTYKLVKDTWPDLLPEEEEKQEVKEEEVVEQ